MTYATSADFFRFGVQIYILANICAALIDEICPICKKTWYPSQKSRRRNSIKESIYTISSCSHRYCVACLERWLKINKTCPMCRQVLFDKWQDDSEDMKGFTDLMEYLDIVDIGEPAATRMNEGRDGRDTKSPWEMIREAKRIMFGKFSGMRTIIGTPAGVGL
jgi:hypothetical protein